MHTFRSSPWNVSLRHTLVCVRPHTSQLPGGPRRRRDSRLGSCGTSSAGAESACSIVAGWLGVTAASCGDGGRKAANDELSSGICASRPPSAACVRCDSR